MLCYETLFYYSHPLPPVELLSANMNCMRITRYVTTAANICMEIWLVTLSFSAMRCTYTTQ